VRNFLSLLRGLRGRDTRIHTRIYNRVYTRICTSFYTSICTSPRSARAGSRRFLGPVDTGCTHPRFIMTPSSGLSQICDSDVHRSGLRRAVHVSDLGSGLRRNKRMRQVRRQTPRACFAGAQKKGSASFITCEEGAQRAQGNGRVRTQYLWYQSGASWTDHGPVMLASQQGVLVRVCQRRLPLGIAGSPRSTSTPHPPLRHPLPHPTGPNPLRGLVLRVGTSRRAPLPQPGPTTWLQ
jgi:hypothetical protein